MTAGQKPKLAVWKFSSCDGCQLSLLDCEDELLAVAKSVEIAYFLEATRARVDGPYDISLVEGSISNTHDLDRLRRIRQQSRLLITIGACATSGGIQALRNFADTPSFVQVVYAHPDYIDSLDSSTPIQDHVPVDFELRGCPVNKAQLLETVNALLNGRRPAIARHSLCMDCKRRGNVCVMVAHGAPCLGPVTQSGCGVLCPSCDRGCYGCFGPMEAPNAQSLGGTFAGQGVAKGDIRRMFQTFNANAEAFRAEAARHEEGDAP